MPRFHIVLTTTLDPTARSNSVPAITTLQATFLHQIVFLVESHSFIIDPVRCPAIVTDPQRTAGGYAAAAALEQLQFLNLSILLVTKVTEVSPISLFRVPQIWSPRPLSLFTSHGEE